MKKDGQIIKSETFLKTPKNLVSKLKSSRNNKSSTIKSEVLTIVSEATKLVGLTTIVKSLVSRYPGRVPAPSLDVPSPHQGCHEVF